MKLFYVWFIEAVVGVAAYSFRTDHWLTGGLCLGLAACELIEFNNHIKEKK
jgi:hypothetical protein